MVTATPIQIEMKHDGTTVKVRMKFADNSKLTVAGPLTGFQHSRINEGPTVKYNCTFSGFKPAEWEDSDESAQTSRS